MSWLESIGAAFVGGIKKLIAAVILLVILAALIHWARNNQGQAQATSDKVMGAVASGIGWAADGVTGMTGGSAAEAAGAGGVQVVMVQNEAPAPWRQSLASAIILWNRGLTGVQLKAGDCMPGLKCIKVSQEADLPPQDGRLVLGRTNFFHDRIKFNRAALGHVPASYIPVSACHEVGHALGAEHRTVRSSCMSKVIGPGVSARPDATDFAKVNAEYGH